VVEEQLATLSLNETKTLVHDQLLDRTLRHVCHSSKKTKQKRNRATTLVRPPPSASEGHSLTREGSKSTAIEKPHRKNAAQRNAV
jgi:hypothetical protein